MWAKYGGLIQATRAATLSDVFNVANMFTAIRVLLVPPIILLMLYRGELPYNADAGAIAGVLFIVAALTDKADGYFARRNHTITRLGQFFDPLADKLLIIPIMFALWHLELLPLWVVLLVTGRELLISGIRVLGARRSISFPASWSGKIKMFSQVVVVATLLFFPASSKDAFVGALVYLMAAITAYSVIDYMSRARREIFLRHSCSDDG